MSNLGAVLARTQRLRNHDIPQALRRTLSPSQWESLALAEAEKVLRVLAEPGEELFIAKFLATLKATSLADGFLLRMNTPFMDAAGVEDFKRARAAVSAKDMGSNLFLGSVQQFEAWVTQWVAEEKNKDARDQGKTDEEIGAFICWLMLTPNPTLREAKARAALLPYITDFIHRKQNEEKLDVATVDAWLKAVLTAWSDLIRLHFGEIFGQSLRQFRGELPLTNP